MTGQQGLRFFLLLEGHVLRNIHVFHLLVSCKHLAQEINKCLHASLVWSWDRGQVPELWTKDTIWVLKSLSGGIRQGGGDSMPEASRARIPMLSCYLLKGRSPWMCPKECVSYCVPSVGEESINQSPLSLSLLLFLLICMHRCVSTFMQASTEVRRGCQIP